MPGNATNYYKNSQGDNPICSTGGELSQPSRLFSPRAATGSELPLSPFGAIFIIFWCCFTDVKFIVKPDIFFQSCQMFVQKK